MLLSTATPLPLPCLFLTVLFFMQPTAEAGRALLSTPLLLSPSITHFAGFNICCKWSVGVCILLLLSVLSTCFMLYFVLTLNMVAFKYKIRKCTVKFLLNFAVPSACVCEIDSLHMCLLLFPLQHKAVIVFTLIIYRLWNPRWIS